MSDKAFALSTAVGAVALTGVFSILGAILANWLTARKEDRIHAKQSRAFRADYLKGLYEAALALVDRLIEGAGKGSMEDQREAERLNIRLALTSTHEIAGQFARVMSVTSTWADSWREQYPAERGRLSAFQDKALRTDANDKARSALVAIERMALLALMVEHLASYDGELVPLAEEYSCRVRKTDAELEKAFTERTARKRGFQ